MFVKVLFRLDLTEPYELILDAPVYIGNLTPELQLQFVNHFLSFDSSHGLVPKLHSTFFPKALVSLFENGNICHLSCSLYRYLNFVLVLLNAVINRPLAFVLTHIAPCILNIGHLSSVDGVGICYT